MSILLTLIPVQLLFSLRIGVLHKCNTKVDQHYIYHSDRKIPNDFPYNMHNIHVIRKRKLLLGSITCNMIQDAANIFRKHAKSFNVN